jgi:hypothetical protein
VADGIVGEHDSAVIRRLAGMRSERNEEAESDRESLASCSSDIYPYFLPLKTLAADPSGFLFRT